MSAEYPVRCACGRTHQVAAGAAGMRLACGCGRHFDVPSLHALRLEAGEPPVSAELMIESLLLEGQLPQEKDCLKCGLPTAEVCCVDVVCERSEVRKAPWQISMLGLLFGHVFLRRSGESKVLGRDIFFRLPLRVCGDCAGRLRRSAVSELLRQTPVYAQLLEKYPHAEITLVR